MNKFFSFAAAFIFFTVALYFVGFDVFNVVKKEALNNVVPENKFKETLSKEIELARYLVDQEESKMLLSCLNNVNKMSEIEECKKGSLKRLSNKKASKKINGETFKQCIETAKTGSEGEKCQRKFFPDQFQENETSGQQKQLNLVETIIN